MKNFKAIIIDDEKEACRNLHYLLSEYLKDGIEVISEAYTTHEAEFQIARSAPDILFIDIEMPGENAFEFLERIHPITFEIIFVTAYDKYAVRAFRHCAIDYLLKPISSDHLQVAIHKLKEKLIVKELTRESNLDLLQFKLLVDEINARKLSQQIILKDGHKSEVVSFKNIICIEALGNYSYISYCKNGITKKMLMTYSIAEYEDMLSGSFFFRIHRSYLINCTLIECISNGENPFLLLRNQTKLPISRRRYPDFRSFLKQKRFYV